MESVLVRLVIEVGGAISPYGHEDEETFDFGGSAIPTSAAKLFVEPLKKDVILGIKYSLRKSPREVLVDALKNQEWFKGIVLAAAFFEHFSSIILKEHTKGGIDCEKLNLDVWILLRFLHSFKLVSSEIFSKMDEINKMRNHLVHNPFFELDKATAERLIKNAIECLASLGVAD